MDVPGGLLQFILETDEASWITVPNKQ